MKDSLAGSIFLAWQAFYFSTLNTSSHCLLASMVTNKRSDVNITDDAYMWGVIALLLFSRFCLSVIWLMCLGMNLFEFITFIVHWMFWMCGLMFHIKFSDHYFFKECFCYFFSLLIYWDFHYAYVGTLYCVSQ